MLKRLIWTEGTVLSIRIRDDLFALAQMRKNFLLEFFSVSSQNDEWRNVDLNFTTLMFTGFFATKFLKPVVSRIVNDGVRINERSPERLMLSTSFERNRIGVDLIRLSDEYSALPRDVVKSDLSPQQDLDLIQRYEFCGMQGDSEQLRQRLARFFETGVNWDDQKDVVFPGIRRPSSQRT